MVSVVSIGNSRGVRLPKILLDKFSIKDKVDMQVSDKGILLSPPKEVRKGWTKAFSKMHGLREDVLENIPNSEAFEWE